MSGSVPSRPILRPACLFNIRLFILFIISSFTLYTNATPSRAADLAFEEALAAMMRANETVQAAHSEVEQREFDARAAQGLYYPRIDVSGRWARIDDPIYLDLNPIRDAMLALHPVVPPAAVPSFEQLVQDDTYWKAQLNLTWPLFTGGRITAANNAARAGTREANAKLRRTSESLTADLASVYFGVRLAEQVVRIRAEAGNVLDQHLFQARRLLQEGFIAKTELLHAQVAQAQGGRELKAARRDLNLAKTALANLLASDAPVGAVTPLFMVADIPPIQTFIEYARDSHPGLDQLTAVVDRAHENVRARKADYWPQVYLFGMRQLHEDDLTVLEPTWAVGVGVNIDLFEGFARNNRLEAARKLEEQAGLIHRKLQRDLETLVTSKYEELMKAREQFNALETSSALVDENLRARRRAFTEGLATSLDVVDAQLSLSAVYVERLRAVYAFDTALAQLLVASGRGHEFVNYLTQAGSAMEKLQP